MLYFYYFFLKNNALTCKGIIIVSQNQYTNYFFFKSFLYNLVKNLQRILTTIAFYCRNAEALLSLE